MSIENDKIMTLADGKVLYDDLRGRVDSKENLLYHTISESTPVVSFDGDGGDIVINKIKAAIVPVQNLHGQSGPYVEGMSSQLWDEEWEIGDISWSTGQNTSAGSANSHIRSKNYIPVLPNTAYAFIIPSNVNYIDFFYYDSNKNFISCGEWGYGVTTMTTPDNCYFIRFSPQNLYGTTYNNDISINYPSTDKEYHPYKNICEISGWTGCTIKVANGTDSSEAEHVEVSYSISFGSAGTVYGGTLTINQDGTGVLYVDSVVDTVTGSNAITTISTDTNTTRFWIGGLTKHSAVSADILKCFSDTLPMDNEGYYEDTPAFCISDEYQYSAWLRLPVSLVGTTESSIKTYLNNNHIHIYSIRETPLVYNLTAAQVKTLANQNYIWANTGDILEFISCVDWNLAMELKGKVGKDDIMRGAGASTAGASGLVPAPVAGDNTKVLFGNGTWGEISGGGVEVYSSVSAFPATGVVDILYIAKATEAIYRWDSTQIDYVQLTNTTKLAKVTFDILTTDWTAITGGYQATVSDGRITADSDTFVLYDASINDYLGNGITTRKDGANNSQVFIANTLPTGTISGVVYALTVGDIVLDGKVNVAQGIANAGKVIKVNPSGDAVPLNMYETYSFEGQTSANGNLMIGEVLADKVILYVRCDDPGSTIVSAYVASGRLWLHFCTDEGGLYPRTDCSVQGIIFYIS